MGPTGTRKMRQTDCNEAARPNYAHEAGFIARGLAPVAGVDEAGRGPWAGPVVAAAVIFDPRAIPDGLDDSKRLTAKRRERLFSEIGAVAHIAVAHASVKRIDRDNIHRASLWAMAQACRKLAPAPAMALIDGRHYPDLACPARAIVKGDGVSCSIAAASIIAKVTRDRMMEDLARAFPDYGFERHKGYGTPEHRAALERFGPTPHHRRSFSPIKHFLQNMPRR